MYPSDRVVLNISGEIYETRLRTLERYPKTLLGNRKKRSFYYCPESSQHVFFRNRLFFDAILYFYQSNGYLECPLDIPIKLFEEECRFFQLPGYAIETLIRRINPVVTPTEEHEDEFIELTKTSTLLKPKIWQFLQDPTSSCFAKFYAWISMFLIFSSVALSCFETMEELKVKTNVFTKNPWAVTELALNLWFLIELLMNIFTTPRLGKYFKQFMTYVDIIAVVPYFVFMALSDKEMASLGFLRSIRLMRIVRVFRLSKQSKRLQNIARVLSSCLEEFKSFFVIVLLTVILAGSTMYYIEKQFADTEDGQKSFTDIPDAIYWGIQTITTLGYGDITPSSTPGMVFAGFVMLFGSIILAIPVQTVITKYQENEAT